jgi:hypothetical protein
MREAGVKVGRGLEEKRDLKGDLKGDLKRDIANQRRM